MHYDLNLILKNWQPLSLGGQRIQYHPGQVIFYHGHRPYGIYRVKSGQFRLQHNPDLKCPEQNPEMTLSQPQGHLFGVQEICADEPHCCTCIAETECDVVFVSKGHIADFFKKIEKEEL